MVNLHDALDGVLLAAKEPPKMNWDALPSLIVALVALGIIVAVACYILSKLRDGTDKNVLDSSAQMTLFSEMYRKGELTKEEYRAIKTQLALSIRASKGPEDSQANAEADDRQAELERLLNTERR